MIRQTRSSVDGNGKRFGLGAVVYIAPEMEKGYWVVTDIVSLGRKGTVVFLRNRDNDTTEAAYHQHVVAV